MIVLLNGIFRRARKVWGLPHNPVADVERLSIRRRTHIDFYSPEEVHAARPRHRQRAGRGALPDRGLHGLAGGRAPGAALARRRLPRPDRRLRELKPPLKDRGERARRGESGPRSSNRRTL